jgi:hypothetical protein
MKTTGWRRWMMFLMSFSALLAATYISFHRPDLNRELVIAVRRGDGTAVRNLLERGADPNATSCDGEHGPPLADAERLTTLA